MAALFGLALARAESPLEPPTSLPPYWIESVAETGDDPAPRPFILVLDPRLGDFATTLKDSLAAAPGVLMQESFGGFEPPRLSIRGSGLQSAPSSRGVAFLLNGFPLGLTDGSFNSALVDPQLFNRVELFRGDAAAPVAPAVLGGAFNLRSGGEPSALVQPAAGSFGASRVSFRGESAPADLALGAAAAIADQQGFREHSAQHRTVFFLEAHRPIPAGCDTSVSVYHAHAVYDVPGPLTLAAAQHSPDAASADVQRDLPRRESALTQLTAQTVQQNAVLSLESGLSWLRSSDRFRQLQANGISDSHSDDLTLLGAFTRRFDTNFGDDVLRLSTNLSRGWRDLLRFRNDSSATGPLFGHNGLFATTASVDLESSVYLCRKLMLTIGGNASSARRDVSERLPGGSTGLRAHSSTLEPRARLTALIRPGCSIHGGMFQSSEPPTFDDLLFVSGLYPKLTSRSQSLLTQRATTSEIGTTGELGSVGWDLTAYTANWHHEILRLADARGLPRGAVNAGPTRHRGIEASTHWHILTSDHHLDLVTTVAWNRFTFVDDPVFGRNRLAGAPPHQGAASLVYEHPSGLFAVPGLDWLAGATPVDHAGRLSYGGYTLANLRVGWRKPKAWTVFAEVKNVFDRRHIASTAGVLDLARNPATTAIFLPGAGRAFSVGLQWNLH